jgi:hypothetical protein
MTSPLDPWRLGGFALWFALRFTGPFTLWFTSPLGRGARFRLGGAVFCRLAVFDISMSVGDL